MCSFIYVYRNYSMDSLRFFFRNILKRVFDKKEEYKIFTHNKSKNSVYIEIITIQNMLYSNAQPFETLGVYPIIFNRN